MPEMLYLLAHKQSELEASNEQAALATLLGELRETLAAVSMEMRSPIGNADQVMAAVHRELLALGWRQPVVDEVLKTAQEVHFSKLVSLPDEVTFPNASLPGVVYADGKLSSRTVLNAADREILKALSRDSQFQTAVSELVGKFELVRQRVDRDLCCIDVRDVTQPLHAWPEGLRVPPELANSLFYDSSERELHFVGAIDDVTFGLISALPGASTEFLDAIANLRAKYTSPPAGTALLLSAEDQDHFLSDLVSASDRCAFLLQSLLPHRQTLALCERLQSTLGLQPATVRSLLTTWLRSSNPSRDAPALSDFLDPTFAEGSLAIPVDLERFPRQFRTSIRLKKIAMIVARYGLTDIALSWLFGPSSGVTGWLNPNDLPAAADEAALPLRPMLRAAGLFELRDQMPHVEASLAAVFSAAQDKLLDRAGLLEKVAEATHWNVADLTVLVGNEGFKFVSDDHLRAALLGDALLPRLCACFATMDRLGATAAQCLAWSEPNVDANAAADIKRLARGRHTDAAWGDVAASLKDSLREKQRASTRGVSRGTRAIGRQHGPVWPVPDRPRDAAWSGHFAHQASVRERAAFRAALSAQSRAPTYRQKQ